MRTERSWCIISLTALTRGGETDGRVSLLFPLSKQAFRRTARSWCMFSLTALYCGGEVDGRVSLLFPLTQQAVRRTERSWCRISLTALTCGGEGEGRIWLVLVSVQRPHASPADVRRPNLRLYEGQGTRRNHAARTGSTLKRRASTGRWKLSLH